MPRASSLLEGTFNYSLALLIDIRNDSQMELGNETRYRVGAGDCVGYPARGGNELASEES